MAELTPRQVGRILTIKESLPRGFPPIYYQGMLYGYRQAVIGIYANVDHWKDSDATWDITTMTALAIEAKMKEAQDV
jgi:hypothetical protein